MENRETRLKEEATELEAKIEGTLESYESVDSVRARLAFVYTLLDSGNGEMADKIREQIRNLPEKFKQKYVQADELRQQLEGQVSPGLVMAGLQRPPMLEDKNSITAKLIGLYVETGQYERAEETYDRMEDCHIKANIPTSRFLPGDKK